MKTSTLLILLFTMNLSAFANMGFRENIGQIKNQNGQPAQAVRFLLQCEGYNVQLRQEGFSYDFIRRNGEEIIIDRVDFIFNDFNPNYSIEKIAPQIPYKTTYVADNGNQQFEKIVYKNFYNGIDIVFKRKGENLFEYDFVISDTGNITDIEFFIKGADITEVQQNELFISNEFIQFKEIIPLSFDNNGKPVDVFFDKSKHNTISFACKRHKSGITVDPTPELLYATYTSDDWNILDVEFIDNLEYITLGSGTPVNVATEGAFQSTLVGLINAILSRFDASNNLVWCTYFGDDLTFAYEFAIANDKIIFCGISTSTELATNDAFQHENGGARDIVITIFSLEGTFEHCTYFGGSDNETPLAVAHINAGKVAIGGQTESSNFPTISSSTSYSDNQDAFIAVFDINNKVFEFSHIIGGEEDEIIWDIIPYSNNEFIFVGASESNNLSTIGVNIPPSSLSANYNGGNDGLIGKVQLSSEIEFIGYLGNTGLESIRFGGINSQNHLILLCSSQLTNIPFTSNAEITSFQGNTDGTAIYIFDNNFNLNYCSLLFQPFSFDYGNLVIDDFDNIFITSQTSSSTNIATPNALQEELFLYPLQQNPSNDAFIMKLSPSGQKLWGTYFGNYSYQVGTSLDVKESRLIISGITGSDQSYPEEYQYSFITEDAFENQLSGSGGFIAIFDQLVDVNEFETSENTIRIFPNPSSDIINLSGVDPQQALCNIYDITGKNVYSNTLNAPAIAIQALPAGVYTLTLQTPSSFQSTKFIKQ